LAPEAVLVTDAIPEYVKKFGDKYGFWEASIAERADGSLFMIGRTYGGHLYGCESRDAGLTWSKPSATSLMSGAAPGRMERIPGSNDLLVIWNSCCLNPQENLLGDRITLSSAISTDGGKTWKWRRVIEDITPGNGNRVEYPAVNIYDGQVYITYRAQTVGAPLGLRMQEYMSILPLSWFYAERDFHRPESALQ
jgi:hypothetical protein